MQLLHLITFFIFAISITHANLFIDDDDDDDGDPIFPQTSEILETKLYVQSLKCIDARPECRASCAKVCGTTTEVQSFTNIFDCLSQLLPTCRIYLRAIVMQRATAASVKLSLDSLDQYQFIDDFDSCWYPMKVPHRFFSHLNPQIIRQWLGFQTNGSQNFDMVHCNGDVLSYMRSHRLEFNGHESVMPLLAGHVRAPAGAEDDEHPLNIIATKKDRDNLKSSLTMRLVENDGLTNNMSLMPNSTFTHLLLTSMGNRRCWERVFTSDKVTNLATVFQMKAYIESTQITDTPYGYVMPRRDSVCSSITDCNTCKNTSPCSWCLTPTGRLCAAECQGETATPVGCPRSTS